MAETLDMFADITSANTASYWNTLQQNEAPYGLELLFPNQKQTASLIEWYKGLSVAPKPLAPSAYDANAIPRGRQGFQKVMTSTNFYKESKYIDEDLRQSLLNVANSPIQAQKDVIFNRIFNDNVDLLRGAALRREIVRAQMLVTGKFSIAGNDTLYAEDYLMPKNHLVKATKDWGTTGATITDDIMRAADTIGTDTGVTIGRLMLNRNTFNVLLRDESIKATLLANNANTQAVNIPKSVVLNYLSQELGVTVMIYDKGYNDVNGKFVKFIPDGKAVFMPQGTLGRTVFSTTPEEADLMASAGADVSIVDTGVAITTTVKDDPVTKVTKVSQAFIPTFEQIDSVYVLDAFAPKA